MLSLLPILALSLTTVVKADWLDWKFTDRDWQIGFVNLTIKDFNQYRSTITGRGAFEFSIKRRDSPDVTTCKLTGWAAPIHPSGWVQCAPDLWFHFGGDAFRDVELQLNILEAKSWPNLTATMRYAEMNLSTRSFEVDDRLNCNADWDKRHLSCLMSGPIFKTDTRSIQPNTTKIPVKPLIVQNIGTGSPPNCSVEIQLEDPNDDIFFGFNPSATDKATCKSSWDCSHNLDPNIKFVERSLDCGAQNGWAANATLFFGSSGGFSKANISAVHSFHVTQESLDTFVRDPRQDDIGKWVNAIVKWKTTLRLGGRREDDPNANSTSLRFNACDEDACL